MINTKIILLLFVASLLFGVTLAQNNPISQITGIIYDDKTSEPINDVTVVLSNSGDIVSSVSDGSFLFSGLTGFEITPNQPLQFSFFKQGYVPVYDTLISVNAFGVNKEIIKLKKRRIERTNQSSFQGIVKYNNNFISDAEVSSLQNNSRPILTNKNGYFFIIIDREHSEDGFITLVFRKEGFKTSSKIIPNTNEERLRIHEINLEPLELLLYGEVKDKNGIDLDSAKVELRIDTISKVTHTNKSGNYKFSIYKYLVTGVNYDIEVKRAGSISQTFRSTIPLPNFIKNDFTLQTKDKLFGLVDPIKYFKERIIYPIQIGIGFGLQSGSKITFGDIPSDIRIIPPHKDDLKDRPDEILDPGITDNYLIYENQVFIDLPGRKSIDLINASLYGLINVTLRTSDLVSSGENIDNNLYTKNYIKPEFYGIALIYYTIKSKERTFFKGNSFSLPIYLTYPVLYFGKNPEINRRLILRVIGGTNILLPPKIELEAENGWDRFGSQEIQETIDIGEIKEIEWFWGFDFEGAISKSVHFNFQLAFIYPDYKKNFKTPLTLQFDKKPSTSFRGGVSVLLNTKK